MSKWVGTPLAALKPEDIRTVGCYQRRFYASEYLWHDFAAVMMEHPERLTWFGGVRAWTADSIKIYEYLEKFGIVRLGDMEYIEIEHASN
jgi:hypothetical protein